MQGDAEGYELALDQRFQGHGVGYSVVELTLTGKPDAVQTPLQQPNGGIELPAHLAQIHNAPGAAPAILGQSGAIEYWTNKQNWVSWRFRTSEAGRFRVQVVLGTCRGSRTLVAGHRLQATVGNCKVAGALSKGNLVDSVRTRYFQESVTDLGVVEIPAAGIHELNVRAVKINPKAPVGIVLAGASLVPAT